MQKDDNSTTLQCCLPRNTVNQKLAIDPVTAYGVRPCDPATFYLSPWEFCQWFFVERLLLCGLHDFEAFAMFETLNIHKFSIARFLNYLTLVEY